VFTKVRTDVLGGGKRRCRTWLGLCLDKKNSLAPESSLSSFRMLKELGGNLSLYVAKFTNDEMSHISTYNPIITSEH